MENLKTTLKNCREKLFKSIKNPLVSYPNDISTEAVDFFKRIFVANPKERLGHNGATEIKNHSFFKSLIWDDILNMKVKPPFMPRISRPDETRYIHSEFLEERPIDSYKTNDSLCSKDDKFLTNSFDYVNDKLRNKPLV